MDFRNKKVCILGLARSGAAAAGRLSACGADVRVSENKTRASVEGAGGRLPIQNPPHADIPMEFGGHTEAFCLDSDMIVISPGVHLDIPVLEEARKRGIPILSEVELASMFFTKPVIAITGTNGKTTTTTLIGEIFKDAGFRVAVGGNIGHPLVSIDDTNLDYVIAEISSYQLETIDAFRPYIAVMLNLTEDHLERYKTMEAYGRAKERIFRNQRQDDHFVYNADDPLVQDMAERASSKKVPFSRKQPVENGLFINDGYLVRLKEQVIEAVIKADDIKIKGDHNIENCLAASAAALLCGISPSDIAKTLKGFAGVEHRIEYVATVKGVDFINDSKGTNPDSTIVALKTVSKNRNVIVILGGRDKGGDLIPMCENVKAYAKAVVLIGEASERFESALKGSGFNDISKAASMEEAVRASVSMSSSGDSVLLSPACASFDMFDDFEHRGRVFKDIVGELSRG